MFKYASYLVVRRNTEKRKGKVLLDVVMSLYHT